MNKWIWYLMAAVITMNVSVTAYTPHECGGNISALGKPCVEGRTVALNGVPLGSIVRYMGKHYFVEDRCGFDNTLDIFMESHSKAIQFGRRTNQEITIYLP